MARLTGPLHSLAASGRVGDKLVFRDAVVGPQVVHRVPASGVASAAQTSQRSRFTTARNTWVNTDWTALDRSLWALEAARLSSQANTYNAVIRASLLGQATDPPWTPIRWDHIALLGTTSMRLWVWKDALPAVNVRFQRATSPNGPWTTSTTYFDSGNWWQGVITAPGHAVRYYLRVLWPVASSDSGRSAIGTLYVP